ncbi:DarT ssDNA thymidine ADP-ribosyltransferase family protein [Novosphingobium sp. fls2-241-R2A-195]|uniref:DarT ssDNA thymidine ADP-ribosyltransferase family protein n=1 Tax=Novosphingobium sp. fls2-241-R2A-195 TaxID=3040296 RepID=UPI00254D0C5C|nr:DarT ssDNA thymidine ADP-ribosyltransferase family protein [Novosphingobium sp. fls2-241-R2A-195]
MKSIAGNFTTFTDVKNLKSIEEHGILSMREIRSMGISPVTGGNQWSLDADKAKGMDKFVHLCFFSSHPMEYVAKKDGRIGESKFLRIDPSILRIPGALIAKDVSNKADAEYGPAEDMIEQVDLEVIYTRTDWKDGKIKERLLLAKKSEILIPDRVTLDYFKI